LITPDMVVFLLLVLGTAMLWTRRRRRTGRRLVTFAVIVIAALAVLPFGAVMTGLLEDRFPTLAAPPASVDGVIVLGGAIRQVIARARGQPSFSAAAERMTAFVALARRLPGAALVFTGGSALRDYPDLKEAAVARQFFAEMGLDAGRIIYEDRATNTYENAVFSYELVKPAAGARWLLVTSAMHMPRAIGAFRKAGWPVIAYPVDYRTTGEGNLRLWQGVVGGIDGFGIALREWLALLGYRLLGRTDSLFPGP
jgi:uncharacterized SAM-binding protein YcdF (DUF218 family)